jgi:hypothetical protein
MKRADPTLATAAIGLLLMAAGAALVFLPAGLAVIGAGLLVYAVFLAPDTGGPKA